MKYLIIFVFFLFTSTSPRQQPHMSAVRYSVQLCGDVPGAHAGKQAPSQVRPKAEVFSPLHSAVLKTTKIKYLISHSFLHLLTSLVVTFNCMLYLSGRRKCRSCASPSRRSTIHSQMSFQITFRSRKLVESPRSLQSSRRGLHRRTTVGREKRKCHLRGMSHNCTNLH